MTQSEVNKLHKSIATDFKIVARKTELWTIPYCYEVLHDIKKLMAFRYVHTISLIMNSPSNVPVKAKKYNINYISQTRNDRPGGIDWEDGEGQSLTVVLRYTQAYQDLSNDQKVLFQRDNLKIGWGPAFLDTNFPHLSQSTSKVYAHSTVSVDRTDFN